MNGNFSLGFIPKQENKRIQRVYSQKPTKVALFTNVRDENHMHEWIQHHFLLGFDDIYIFDHMSKIPVKKQCNNLHVKTSNNLFISNCYWKNPVKLPLMQHAVNISKKKIMIGYYI